MYDVFLPLLLVLFAATAAPGWHIRRRWLSLFFGAGFAYLLLRYAHWRLTVTVWPVDMPSVNGVVVWVVFLVEMLAWYEGLNLASVILCRTDRSGEADANEARSRDRPPSALPEVDVFIATYNEPLEVLEKTIAGALALDWPAGRLNIHVLDDGDRGWLASYCAERGVNHLTREGGAHAKAGNINAALTKTHAPFVLILDADFVPLRPMLRRAIGFFDDPAVGIVQMPHHFFNSDPVQTNLRLDADLPDEQRLFFDVIQPGRDGLDCAFCCGSNGILRRSALEEIGGGLPTDSVTEDMLLSLALYRKGYVTRYLNERLAIGLAPENLAAYFVQRGRWAKGAIQTLYTRHGPFGPGLRLVQRILFFPSHWISQSLCQPVSVLVPAFFLLTGIPPLVNVSTLEIVYFQLPVVVGSVSLMIHLAGGKFGPLSSSAQSLLQALRVAPVVVSTFLDPGESAFKVTPKGKDARVTANDGFVLKASLGMFFVTGIGLLLNSNDTTRIVADRDLLPVVGFWAAFNMVVLLLVAAMAISRPVQRGEERFALADPCRVAGEAGILDAAFVDISVSGCQVRTTDPVGGFACGGWTAVHIDGVGAIPAVIMRVFPGPDGAVRIGLRFRLESGPLRDRLIQRLFADGLSPATGPKGRVPLTMMIIARLLQPGEPAAPPAAAGPEPETPPAALPVWLAHHLDAAAGTVSDMELWLADPDVPRDLPDPVTGAA